MKPWAAITIASLCFAGAAGRVVAQGADQPGKPLYDKNCAQCHGEAGDGKGIAWLRVKPAPRDFTAGKFKVRTTPSGSMPTDEDLKKIIREGMPYTSMPPWPQFTEQEVANLIAYIKTFSPAFTDPERNKPAITVPKTPPAYSEDSAKKGAEVYKMMGCAACHGESGRGSGSSAPSLKDDWGHHLRPADMTKRWTFRGGPTRTDIYRTFSTGMMGTPMPSFADSLTEEQRWQLVDYIYSLGSGDAADYATLAIARGIDDNIDLENSEELFKEATPARFPLVGQIMQPGRAFHPLATDVEVSAVFNDRDIAIRVQWHDMSREDKGSNDPSVAVPDFDEAAAAEAAGAAGGETETGGGEPDFWGAEEATADAATSESQDAEADAFWDEGTTDTAAAESAAKYSDAVAIQLPVELPAGIRKPYFLFGDASAPVSLWFMDLAGDEAQRFVAGGSENVEPAAGTGLESVANYNDGLWTVVFKRPLRAKGEMAFAEDQFFPIAFSVWDGFSEDRGNKRALTAWQYLYIEPRDQVSVAVPMAKSALTILIVELAIIFILRRKFAGGLPGERRKAKEAV